MDELYAVLREWGALLVKLYMERRMTEFYKLKERMDSLFLKRKALLGLSALGSPEEAKKREAMKADVIREIERGREDMHLDVVVRLPNGEHATMMNTSFIKLYWLHQLHSVRMEETKDARAHRRCPNKAAILQQLSSAYGEALPSAAVVATEKSSEQEEEEEEEEQEPTQHPSLVSYLSISDLSVIAAGPDESDSLPSYGRKSMALGKGASGGGTAGAGTGANAGRGTPPSIILMPTSVLVMMDLKIFMAPVGEPSSVFFSIWSENEKKFISDEFQVKQSCSE